MRAFGSGQECSCQTVACWYRHGSLLSLDNRKVVQQILISAHRVVTLEAAHLEQPGHEDSEYRHNCITGTVCREPRIRNVHPQISVVRRLLELPLDRGSSLFLCSIPAHRGRAVTADQLCDSRSRRSMKTGPIGTQGDPCGSPQWPQRYCLVPRRPITGIRPARGGEQPSRPPFPDPVSAHCHGVCGTRSSDGRSRIAPRARNPITTATTGRTTLVLLATGERVAAKAACITR